MDITYLVYPVFSTKNSRGAEPRNETGGLGEHPSVEIFPQTDASLGLVFCLLPVVEKARFANRQGGCVLFYHPVCYTMCRLITRINTVPDARNTSIYHPGYLPWPGGRGKRGGGPSNHYAYLAAHARYTAYTTGYFL